jgi:hypothetical protein
VSFTHDFPKPGTKTPAMDQSMSVLNVPSLSTG